MKYETEVILGFVDYKTNQAKEQTDKKYDLVSKQFLKVFQKIRLEKTRYICGFSPLLNQLLSHY